jgi:hypothetical protein
MASSFTSKLAGGSGQQAAFLAWRIAHRAERNELLVPRVTRPVSPNAVGYALGAQRTTRWLTSIPQNSLGLSNMDMAS